MFHHIKGCTNPLWECIDTASQGNPVYITWQKSKNSLTVDLTQEIPKGLLSTVVLDVRPI